MLSEDFEKSEVRPRRASSWRVSVSRRSRARRSCSGVWVSVGLLPLIGTDGPRFESSLGFGSSAGFNVFPGFLFGTIVTSTSFSPPSRPSSCLSRAFINPNKLVCGVLFAKRANPFSTYSRYSVPISLFFTSRLGRPSFGYEDGTCSTQFSPPGISNGKSGSEGTIWKEKAVPPFSAVSTGENLRFSCEIWKERGSSACDFGTGLLTTRLPSAGGGRYRRPWFRVDDGPSEGPLSAGDFSSPPVFRPVLG